MSYSCWPGEIDREATDRFRQMVRNRIARFITEPGVRGVPIDHPKRANAVREVGGSREVVYVHDDFIDVLTQRDTVPFRWVKQVVEDQFGTKVRVRTLWQKYWHVDHLRAGDWYRLKIVEES